MNTLSWRCFWHIWFLETFIKCKNFYYIRYKKITWKDPITINFKLEATYGIPITTIEENNAFKTNSKIIFKENDIHLLVEEDFNKLVIEEEYIEKEGGFYLLSISEVLLTVNKFRPLALDWMSLIYE